MYRIIQNRNIWLSISATLVTFAVLALMIWGLNLGIDFTGGSLLEVRFLNARPDVVSVQDSLAGIDLGSFTVQPIDEQNMILRFQNINEDIHQQVLRILDGQEVGEIVATSTGSIFSNVEELRFDSVGPSIGAELKSKSVSATLIVLIAIVLYIAWAFRKVSKPVASWKYGLTAIVALFHDVLITLGVFAVLGQFMGLEINTAFVAAILTVLGYSVNDTIVVFDRIRENLPKSNDDFENTINTSVNQTITRSINTSITTLLVLGSIVIFGGATIRDFVLALSIGVFIGTYSSIFLASPLLVVWEKMKK